MHMPMAPGLFEYEAQGSSACIFLTKITLEQAQWLLQHCPSHCNNSTIDLGMMCEMAKSDLLACRK